MKPRSTRADAAPRSFRWRSATLLALLALGCGALLRVAEKVA